jgi:hypothetical protein
VLDDWILAVLGRIVNFLALLTAILRIGTRSFSLSCHGGSVVGWAWMKV